MKYSAVILALAVGAFALPQEASSITSAPPSGTSASLTPQQTCLNACDATDVTCRAQCLGVARPNESQVADTTDCAMECNQGSGSPEDTKKYGDCLQKCYADFFPSSQTLGGNAPNGGAATGTAATGTAAENGPSGTAQGTGAEPTGDATGSAAPESTGAAAINSVHIAGAGLAGLVLAVFSL